MTAALWFSPRRLLAFGGVFSLPSVAAHSWGYLVAMWVFLALWVLLVGVDRRLEGR